MTPEGYQALREGAAMIDFSARGRLCLLGNDRQAFLNGQVTNNVKDLRPGQGCYAALANAKAKMTADLNIFVLLDEILLDFEPGLTAKVSERLQKFIIADDVQIVDASASFGLVSILGPQAKSICARIGLPVPNKHYEIVAHGNAYVANTPRLVGVEVDIFYPKEDLSFLEPLRRLGVTSCSEEAFEAARIEEGIPRFGADMDENTLAPEALDERAISYRKGCYIGQEVISRIRTYGQVAKALRGLRFDAGAPVPARGEKILHDGNETGWITSAVFSPKLERPIALGYVRKECNQIGTRVFVGELIAEITPVPFQKL